MLQIVKRLFLFLLLFAPLTTYAQMFSVPDRQERINRPNTIIRVGTSIATFDYQGTLTDPDQSLLEVDNALFAVTFETQGLTANINVGNSLSGIDDGSFLNLNLRFTNGFGIVRQAGIPIQLSTGLTTSNNDFTENRFNQTYFSGGTGLFLNINPSRKIQFSNSGVIGYGFSNSNGGFFGGTLNYVNIGSRINLLNFIGQPTLSIGYEYIFNSYDIDSEIYDYDLTGHQVTLGISF
jgi:hypothetical protein